MEGSAWSARWASEGLHAPRMRYGDHSTPSLACIVATASISVRTPKPSGRSADSISGRASCAQAQVEG
jgi:hypothetical protein